MNNFSLPRNLVLSALLAGLLAACQTRQARETVEMPPPPPEAPAQESSQVPDSKATTEPAPDETASVEKAAAETGEQQQSAHSGESGQTAEQAAPDPAEDTGERAAAVNQPETAPLGGADKADQAIAETESAPAGSAGGEAAQNSDARFREAMRRFDRRLARERFGTEQGDEAANGSEASSGMGGGIDEGGPAASSDSGNRNGNPFEGDDEGTEHAPATGRGGIGERNTHSPPPGTPDGHDDDIVARQLREAAESEPDPELRERLWEEYRAYKNDQE